MSWRHELVIFTFGLTVTSVRPARDRAIAYAHFLPWPAASISVVGPVTKSPHAKTPRTFVAYVAGSTFTRPRLTSKSASTGRKVRSAAWDTAGMTTSALISNSEPGIGTGDRRPEASGSPS